MKYTKENIPTELHPILDYQELIIKYREKSENVLKELKDWCRENRKNLKTVFPIKGKAYVILDIKSALSTWEYYQLDIEQTYYFIPTYCEFNPDTDWWGIHSTKMPTVSGNIVDCNNRILFESQRVEITNLNIIDEKAKAKEQMDFTYVYLMIDKNTGYYKIGRSKNPTIREKTLQSEKPTIELLHKFDAISKDEKTLHEMFNEKRVRGEWFDLSGSDVKVIQNYFQL